MEIMCCAYGSIVVWNNMARSKAGSTPQRKNRRRGTDIRRPAAFLFRRAWIWRRLMTHQAAARADGMLEDQDALGEMIRLAGEVR